MPTIYGINMAYTYGTSEYNELMHDADMLPDLDEYKEMMFDETMQRINQYDETQGNCELFDYYIAIQDHIFFDDDLGFISNSEQINTLVMSIFEHFDCLKDDEIIHILIEYEEYGVPLHKIVDNEEDNNNIIILFLNEKKYHIVHQLLTLPSLAKQFDTIRKELNSDEQSINSLLKEWKTEMSLAIAKYTNYQNADIVNMIIEGAYDDIFEKIYTF
jgi:hypothetical protein